MDDQANGWFTAIMNWVNRVAVSLLAYCAVLALIATGLVAVAPGARAQSLDGSIATVAGSTPFADSSSPLAPPTGRLAEPLTYVAMGDSFTSTGSIVGMDPMTFGSFGGDTCFRSADNYPSRIREATNWNVIDVSCRGLKVPLTYTSRAEYGPPQINALHSGVDLVSLQVGGNDTDVLRLAELCVLSADCSHLEREWAAKVPRVAPGLRQLLRDIRARAPRARIVLVGYLQPFHPVPCVNIAPYSAANQNFGRRHIDRLNAMLREVARAEGVEIVADRAPPGHSACDPDRWTSFLGVDAGAVPLHPTHAGHLATARMILDRV